MLLNVTIPKSYKFLLPYTNNMVEYESFIFGLKLTLEWKLIALEVYGDSQLVIN